MISLLRDPSFVTLLGTLIEYYDVGLSEVNRWLSEEFPIESVVSWEMICHVWQYFMQ